MDADAAAALMERIDAALAPAVQHASGLGTASLGDLSVVLRCVRQAFATAVYPAPPATPEAEPVASDPEPTESQAADPQTES